MLNKILNYTTEPKQKSVLHDNYTDDMTRDTSKENGNCHACIFIGDNDWVSVEHLCAKHVDEIAEVKFNGHCDKCKPAWHWYNQINPVKKWLVEKTGFKFKNR